MKKTLLWALLLAALLALLTGAALAEPWAGSGTESDPWLITSAADLVALREYVAAGETTSGKYFKQTENIGLASVCGEGVGDWIPIGSDDTGKYFNGTYDGGSHTLSGIYREWRETFRSVRFFTGRNDYQEPECSGICKRRV